MAPVSALRRTRSGSVSSDASSVSSSTSQLDVIRDAYSTSDSDSEMSAVEEEVASTSTGGGVMEGGVQKRTTQRRRRTARLTRPKTKREYRPRKDAIEKALREETGKAAFPLSKLEWSHWKKAIQRKHPHTASWESRLEGHPGARHTAPFADTSRPAVYEVAVKTPESSEKVPVLASVKQGIRGQSWEAALLSKDKLRRQVDRVLRRGCKLYVRQAPFSVRDMPEIYRRAGVDRKSGRAARSTADAVSELRGLMTRVCDYAWRDHYDIDSRTYAHRPLTMDGVKVSD